VGECVRYIKPGFSEQACVLFTRHDYTEEGWHRVAAIRTASRWEAPISEATDMLRARGYHEVPMTITPAATENEECGGGGGGGGDAYIEVHTEKWTCWAGTRVDYAWISAALLEHLGTSGASVHLTAVHSSLTISDHRPLLLTLRHPERTCSSGH